jgi:hypothetical protein
MNADSLKSPKRIMQLCTYSGTWKHLPLKLVAAMSLATCLDDLGGGLKKISNLGRGGMAVTP